MNRISVITHYIRQATGKILHIGCVGKPHESIWLHKHIVRVAEHTSVIGVDTDAEGIQTMQQQGYLAETCDVMNLAVQFPAGHFGLVVAGEIIEHVSDQKGFLQACASVLAPGGVLLVTTPNPYGICFTLWYWLIRQEQIVNPEHVLWHTPRTMTTLAESADMRVVSVHHCTWGGRPRWWAWPRLLLELWPAMRPDIVYGLKKKA